jgi:hypothetical protein
MRAFYGFPETTGMFAGKKDGFEISCAAPRFD